MRAWKSRAQGVRARDRISSLLVRPLDTAPLWGKATGIARIEPTKKSVIRQLHIDGILPGQGTATLCHYGNKLSRCCGATSNELIYRIRAPARMWPLPYTPLSSLMIDLDTTSSPFLEYESCVLRAVEICPVTRCRVDPPPPMRRIRRATPLQCSMGHDLEARTCAPRGETKRPEPFVGT